MGLLHQSSTLHVEQPASHADIAVDGWLCPCHCCGASCTAPADKGLKRLLLWQHPPLLRY